MSKSITSEQVTNGIRIKTNPRYVPENSRPEENKFFFSYTITIINENPHAVQLLSRYWIIINSEGEREEVKGPGVVGKTPIIKPNESFEYTSFCPLSTSWGTMEGSYTMRTDKGEEFEAEIKRFVLVSDLAGED